MNREKLTEYAQLMKEYDLAGLEIEEEGCRVKLERLPKPPKGHPGGMPPFGLPPSGHGPMDPADVPPRSGEPYGMPFGGGDADPGRYDPKRYDRAEGDAQSRQQPSAAKASSETVTSPMVGIFYQAPAENAQPYVRAGEHVKKGDTLCIIEAMKLMNEITAERDGKITAVLAENGQVVEYGTPLFAME